MTPGPSPADRVRRTMVLLLLLLVTAAPACRPAAGPAPAGPLPGGSSRPRVHAPDLERMLHRLINREREQQRLAPLAWDDALARIARGHSRDMSRRGYFGHASPEGRDLGHRYAQEGYRCAVRAGNVRYEGAENLALNNLYDAVRIVNGKADYAWNSEERIAETTVRGWMDSPGHRSNILTPHWGKEGIGVVIDPDGRVYITQNFC